MKLYNSNFAPNPRRVRIFLAEKGLSIPRVEVDLAKLEHKTAEFSALNPFQTIPVLELDDGTIISESIAICRYVEELHPEPNLFGATPLERATVEMWQRLLELAPAAADRPGYAPLSPAYGEDGGASGRRLGGGQPPAGAASTCRSLTASCGAAVHCGRSFHRRRHHRPRRARLHSAGAHRDPAGTRPFEPLAE